MDENGSSFWAMMLLVTRYHLLGPVEVRRGNQVLELGTPKQRAVLALLLLEAGRVVSTDRLIEAVWGADAPASVLAGLQAYVSNLRKLLRDDASATSPIVRRSPGYVVEVEPGDLDVTAFLADAEAARAAVDAGDWAGAIAAAERGLGRWRGPLIADYTDEPWVREAAVALEESRAATRRSLVTAQLGAGRIDVALAGALALHRDRPLDEPACRLHMIALYRAGRAPDALAEHRDHVRRLDEELGLQPGPALRELQGRILRQDPTLDGWPGRGAPAPAPEPAPTPASDLVGRERELVVIDAVLAEAGPRWLVLTGEAGIGKTRLATEALRRGEAAGARAVRTSCPDDEGLPAWWPVRHLLQALGLDPAPLLVPPADAEADEARYAVYQRIREALSGVGRALLLVDDVQWADPASLRLLTHLAETGLPPGVLVVLTARDGAGGPAVARLLAATARRAGTRRLAVPLLTAPETAELAARISGSPLDADEAAHLAEQTGGNPFFVGEYARLPADERSTGEVPVAIRSVLGLRLSALDPAVLQVLRAAALIGDLLDVGLLATVTRLDLDTLADLLDEAADEHIIVAAPGGYAFAHALLREEILAGVSASRRRRLHLVVADAIGPDATGDRLARRAGHLLDALPLADPAVALEACRAAALDAEHRWSSDSAAHWWAAALQAGDQLPAQDAGARDELLLAQVGALARAGRGQTVLDVVDAALLDAVRAGRVGSAGRLAASLLRTSGCWPWAAYGSDPGPLLARLAGIEPLVAAEPAAHARILASLAVGSCYDPDPGVPDGLSARAIAIADELGDPEILADALLGRALAFAGVAARVTESVDLLDRLAALPHEQDAVDGVIRHGLLSMVAFTGGDVGAAAEHVRLGSAGSDLLRLVVLRAQLRWMEGALAQWHGDLDRAETLYTHAYELHQRTELYYADVHPQAMLALRWDQGRLAGATDLDASFDSPREWIGAMVAAARADPAAPELLRGAIAHTELAAWTTHARLAMLGHAVADLRLADLVGPLVARLEPAAEQLATLGQIGVAGPVALALARLEHLRGDRDRARAHLATATGLAERGGGRVALLRGWLVAREIAGAGPPDPVLAAEADALGAYGVAAAART